MTREEALVKVKGYLTDLIPSEDYDIVEEIMSALEQQHCGDCISRQAAKLKVARVTWKDGDSCNDFHDKCVDCLDDLVPVTPQPKIGQWIKHDTGHSIYYDCSLCGCLAPCTETADEIIWKMANYCPDCGAKMEKSKDEDN